MDWSQTSTVPARFEDALEARVAAARVAVTPELRARLAAMNAEERAVYAEQLGQVVEEETPGLALSPIKAHPYFSTQPIDGSTLVNGRAGLIQRATGRFGKTLAATAAFLAALVPAAAALSDGLTRSAYAQQAPGQTLDNGDVSAANPIHRTVSSTPRRHLPRAAPDPITRADYVMPLEGDNSQVTLVLANADPNTVNAKIYTDQNKTSPWKMTLAPGETKTMTPGAGYAGFLTLDGATTNENVVIIGQHNHVVNGKVVTETVPAIPVADALGMERGFAPAPLVPGRVGEAGTVAQGYWLITLEANAGSEVGLAHRAGNVDADHITRHALPAWSALYVPDVLAELNVPGISTGQLLFQPTAPGIIAFTKLVDNTSGDHNTVIAMPKRLAENKFSFPIVRHLTTGVPFAQYTDIDVINPDQSPLQQFFGAAYQPRGATGTPTDGGGAQLFALTHYLYEDAIQTFFGHNSNPADMIGASTGSNAATMLVWNRIRTAMPHGDVGAMFPALNHRDACGTVNEYQCNLIGLRNGDGFTTKIELQNLGSLDTIVKVEVITEGVIAGSQQVTLGGYENKELDNVVGQYGTLTNARVRLTTVRSGGSGNNMDAFTAAAITTSTDGDEDYQQAVKGAKLPAAKVTGEDYVTTWWDRLQNTRGFLSKTEAPCMIRGNCGTRSYALDIATPLQQAYPTSWATPQDLANLLMAWTDGNDANGELYQGKDPLAYVQSVSQPNVGFLMKPNGGAVPFNLNATQMATVFGVIHSFLASYVDAHPDQYGGNTTTGPNLQFDPTWDTQNSN